MARYHSEFKFEMDPRPVLEQIHQYLMSEGYDYRDYRGEQVYKKGVGIAQGPTFFKIMAGNGLIVVEAWIKWTFVPGVYFGELGITGTFAAIPKSILRTRVQYVEYLIAQAGGVGMAPAVTAQPQMQGYMPGQQPMQQSQPVQPVQAKPVSSIRTVEAKPVSSIRTVEAQPVQPAPVQYQSAAPVQKPAPAFCSQCGNRLTPGSKFCNQCGAQVQ